MHIAALAGTLLAITTGAQGARAVSMATGDSEEWKIEGLARPCSADAAECVWRFAVFRAAGAGGSRTACEHALRALPDGTPASRIRGSGATLCVGQDDDHGGPYNYTVTSGWSDQFGDDPDKAFTTLSVIDYDSGLLVYPSYTDAQVQDGKPVEPDRSYPVHLIPSKVD